MTSPIPMCTFVRSMRRVVCAADSWWGVSGVGPLVWCVLMCTRTRGVRDLASCVHPHACRPARPPT